MESDLIYQLLMFALPSGFVSGVATWWVSRRQRNNDFLAEMQRSIDLLSEKYNAVLQDNVQLRQEKADWQVTQRELLTKVDRLTREVENLRRNFNQKQKKDEKSHSGSDSPVIADSTADERLQRPKDAGEEPRDTTCRKPRSRCRTSRSAGLRKDGSGDGDADPSSDNETALRGEYSGIDNDGGGTPPEPP